MTRYTAIGQALDIRFLRTVNGVGITGITSILFLTIQRSSDLLFWTGSGWGSLTLLTMTEISAINNPGEFQYIGPTPLVSDTYNCHCYITSGLYACDTYEVLVAQTSNDTLQLEMLQVITNLFGKIEYDWVDSYMFIWKIGGTSVADRIYRCSMTDVNGNPATQTSVGPITLSEWINIVVS